MKYLKFKTPTVSIACTPETTAEMFCSMGSDEQAQFFVEVTKIAETWEKGYSGGELQWCYMGRDANEEQKEAIRTVSCWVWLAVMNSVYDMKLDIN